MAGTDRQLRGMSGLQEGAPVFVLVGPQLGENIGTAARAMLNCGLADMRLVAPRDGWPNPDAIAAASGASAVLERASCFDSVADAVADCHRVFATTARTRDMDRVVMTPQGVAQEIRQVSAEGARCAVLFGRERTGLTNDEVVLADTLVRVPLHPGFSSLNLAQAVLLLGYAWFQAGDETPDTQRMIPAARQRATHAQMIGLFEHLEGALDQRGFYKTEALRPTMVRNIRNFLQRADLTDQEVRTLHGIVTALGGQRKDQLS